MFVLMMTLLLVMDAISANAAHARMRHSAHTRANVALGAETNGFVHDTTSTVAKALSNSKLKAQLLAERAKNAAQKAQHEMAKSRAILRTQASEATAAGAELVSTGTSSMTDIGNALEKKMQSLIKGGNKAVHALEETKRDVEQSMAPMRKAAAQAKLARDRHNEEQQLEAEAALRDEDLPTVQQMQSKMSVLQTKLRHAQNKSDVLKSEIDHSNWHHRNQIANLRNNITLQMRRLQNASGATKNATDGKLALVAHSKKVLLHEPINRSICISPCPCDDLGFSLCECCAMRPNPVSIPAAQAKEQADEAKVTTTYSALRELKHRSHNLEDQCRTEREASDDAHRRSVVLGVALSEAVTTLSQYRRMLATPAETSHAEFGDERGSAVQKYVVSSMAHIASIKKEQNVTLKRLAIATERAQIVCQKWDVAHKMFVTAVKRVGHAIMECGDIGGSLLYVCSYIASVAVLCVCLNFDFYRYLHNR